MRSCTFFLPLLVFPAKTRPNLGGSNTLPTVQRGQPSAKLLVELRHLCSACPFVFFQQAERLSHNLTGGVVAAALHCGLKHIFAGRKP